MIRTPTTMVTKAMIRMTAVTALRISLFVCPWVVVMFSIVKGIV